MNRRTLLASFAALPLAACETLDPALIEGVLGGGALTQGEAALGIREALGFGVDNALSGLGRVDGFFGNPQVRIPLPGVLRDVQSVLAPLGAGGLLSELEQQLNRGAERAVPAAANIFLDAIRGLTIQDALAIVRGPDTAATDYLRDRTTDGLTALFSPIMEDALGQTGALQLVDELERQAPPALLGTAGLDVGAELVRHGVEFGLRGVFQFIAAEEAAIRSNPAERTTAILRRVFG
jgi:hypothetical protein